MAKPVLVLVDDEDASRQELTRELGDVRHSSVKRVASAVGEGSVTIRLVHDYLAVP